MGIIDYANKKLSTYSIWDIGLTKLAAFTFALLLASLWPVLISLAWYWYLIIVILAGVRPLWKFWR